MLESMTALQFAEWIAYYSLEPFGEERADWRQAVTSTILANANRAKNSKVAKFTDFMLNSEAEETHQHTEQEQQNVFERIDAVAEKT